jgi:hypothetical protein
MILEYEPMPYNAKNKYKIIPHYIFITPYQLFRMQSDTETTSTTKVETLDQLKKNVREWVRIDNELRALNKEITSRRNEKKNISKRLIDVMRENKLDIFDLKDGQLMYVKKNKKKPITQKQLLTLLSTYYKEDAAKAEEMHTYLMDNREEVVEETIQRKIVAP